MKLVGLVLFLVFIASAPAAQADIYVGRTEDCTVSLTDNPTDTSYRLVVETDLPEGYELPSEEELEEIVAGASEEFGPPEPLIYAVIQVESTGDSTAVSPKGAKGLMQLMPATAQELGVDDIYDPRENIYGGTRYLQKMISRFDGDLRLALAAYNAGPSRVDEYGGVPPFAETENFIQRVESAWDDFKSQEDTIYTYRDENGILNVTNIQ